MDATEYLTLAEASKLVPGRPHPSCLWRWCRKGVQTRGGERIRLQHHRLGSRIFVTLEWLRLFGEELAKADSHFFDLANTAQTEAIVATRTVPRRRCASRSAIDAKLDQRERENCAAEKDLDDAGVR